MAQDRSAAWSAGRPQLNGWPITLWATVAVCTASSFVFTLNHGGVEGWRSVVRISAKTSLLFFLAAFVASSARVFWRGPLTKWLLANRRYVGVSFAASHAVHLLGIVCVAKLDPAFRFSPVTLVFGGLGYVLLFAMAATSFDGAVDRLGLRRWKLLHKTGMYVLWTIFFVSYLPRMLSHSAWYALFVVPLVAALALRGAAWSRQRKA
jgi:methionine sulfoxide reductase heme-binding subunit